MCFRNFHHIIYHFLAFRDYTSMLHEDFNSYKMTTKSILVVAVTKNVIMHNVYWIMSLYNFRKKICKLRFAVISNSSSVVKIDIHAIWKNGLMPLQLWLPLGKPKPFKFYLIRAFLSNCTSSRWGKRMLLCHLNTILAVWKLNSEP